MQTAAYQDRGPVSCVLAGAHLDVVGRVDEAGRAAADLLPVDVHADLGCTATNGLDPGDDGLPLSGVVEQCGTHLGLHINRVVEEGLVWERNKQASAKAAMEEFLAPLLLPLHCVVTRVGLGSRSCSLWPQGQVACCSNTGLQVLFCRAHSYGMQS